MNIKYLSIISSTYISLINCAVHFERIYGVADEDLGKYQKTPDNLFHCLDGNGVIPYSSLNDDYCDCADGSDEPGTPACPNSKFYCENHGSKGNFIPSSRVNDGVCDYELCCDGSDEYNGIIICPDRCEEMARIEEREKTKKILNYVMSFQKYQKMLVNSLANITLDSTTFLEKKAMHLAENEKLDKLKDKIKHLEEIEKESKDFYKSLFRELRSEYRVTRARLIESVKDIIKLKNYKNMDQVEIDNILNNYDEIYLKEIVPEGTEIKEYENEDELIKEEEEEENRLVQEKRDIYNSIRSELTTLRVERNDLDRTVRGYKREAEELEKKLNMDSGKNDIFYSIYGETFTLNTTDYIYTFIWGKEIKQKQRKGGNLTLLGKFKEFRDDYKSIFYDEGAQCWNGPKRSVKINLVCEPKNQIIKIDEPNKCEYVMKFATPGVCIPEDLKPYNNNDNSSEKDETEFSEDMIEAIKAMINESPTQPILDEDEVLGKENTKEEEEEKQEEKQEQKQEQKVAEEIEPEVVVKPAESNEESEQKQHDEL